VVSDHIEEKGKEPETHHGIEEGHRCQKPHGRRRSPLPDSQIQRPWITPGQHQPPLLLRSTKNEGIEKYILENC
jgi:hypothetical protein